MQEATEVVLTYSDSTLRQADVELFEDGKWLNDNCISFYLEHLLRSDLKDNESILLVDPCLSALIAFEQEFEELEEYCQPLKVSARDYLLIPVNDKEDKFMPVGGSHWALLVLNVKEQAFFYYDSAGGLMNNAIRIAHKFVSLLKGSMFKEDYALALTEVKGCAKQQNSYDCGMYTLLNIRDIVQGLVKGQTLNSSSLLTPEIEPSMTTQMRAEIRKLIEQLVKQRVR